MGRKWLAERYYRGKFLHNQTDMFEKHSELKTTHQRLQAKLSKCIPGDRFMGQLLKPYIASSILVGAQCHDIGSYVWALAALKQGADLLRLAESKRVHFAERESLSQQLSKRLRMLRGSLFDGPPQGMVPASATSDTHGPYYH